MLLLAVSRSFKQLNYFEDITVRSFSVVLFLLLALVKRASKVPRSFRALGCSRILITLRLFY